MSRGFEDADDVAGALALELQASLGQQDQALGIGAFSECTFSVRELSLLKQIREGVSLVL